MNCSSVSIPTKVEAVCGVASFRSIFQTFEEYAVGSSETPGSILRLGDMEELGSISRVLKFSTIWINSCPLLPQDLAVWRFGDLYIQGIGFGEK